MKQLGIIRPYVGYFLATMRLADAGIIALLWLVSFWFTGYPWISEFVPILATGIIIYALSAERAGLYRSWRGSSNKQESIAIFRVWAIVVFAILLIFFSTKSSSIYSRQLVLTWFVSTPLVLSLQRICIRVFLGKMRQKGHNLRRVAIVGTGPIAQQLANRISDAAWSGLKVDALFCDDAEPGSQPLQGYDIQVAGRVDDLITANGLEHYDVIYLTLSLDKHERIQSLVTELANSTSSVYVVPDLFVSDLLDHSVVDLNGLPVISVFESPFEGFAGIVKRIEDLVLALLILPLILLPLLTIALAIKLTSNGPVLFKQRRYGLDGQDIIVWKFRTMAVCESPDDFKQATRNDSRITLVGGFLRRTSLDELPQFFNVLQGNMSVVGPRPHPVALNEKFRTLIPGYMLRHKLKPGITGWAQVNGWRGETDTLDKMQKRIEYDLDYFRRWSLLFDLQIVSMTVLKEFGRGRNAY